jgi:ADP-ribose pyrophosphatase YjhB (NUDIX family)
MKIRDIEVKIVKSGKAPDDGLSKSGKVDEHAVRAACRGVISRAVDGKNASVVLPAFGVAAGFPLVGCAKIMSQEVLRAGREAKEGDVLKEIVMCLPTDDALALFEAQVYGYLRHVTQDLGWGPYVTTDIIIEIEGKGIIMIERTNPPFGWALPGGFVDRGESLETAARREAKEETAMDLEDLKQFHTYSDPSRDPRFHTVTVVFTAKGAGTPCAGDDAKGLKVVPFAELRKISCAFDHNQVIDDYLRKRFP